jgi:hypothetical protein
MMFRCGTLTNSLRNAAHYRRADSTAARQIDAAFQSGAQ